MLLFAFWGAGLAAMVATGRWLRTKRMTCHFDKFQKTCIISDMSASEVIRQAISFYIGTNKLVPADAFGLWQAKQPTIDGLAYQEQARAEW